MWIIHTDRQASVDMAGPGMHVGDTQAGRRAWRRCAHEEEVGLIVQPVVKRKDAAHVYFCPTPRGHSRVELGARANPKRRESLRDIVWRDLVPVVVCGDIVLSLAKRHEVLRKQGRP